MLLHSLFIRESWKSRRSRLQRKRLDGTLIAAIRWFTIKNALNDARITIVPCKRVLFPSLYYCRRSIFIHFFTFQSVSRMCSFIEIKSTRLSTFSFFTYIFFERSKCLNLRVTEWKIKLGLFVEKINSATLDFKRLNYQIFKIKFSFVILSYK